jgi:hypothetical protein
MASVPLTNAAFATFVLWPNPTIVASGLLPVSFTYLTMIEAKVSLHPAIMHPSVSRMRSFPSPPRLEGHGTGPTAN